ncbi:hypothetical protein LTS08_006163 [Lithohypha guttulata]|uniref:uncharacterized protein n=1 Tax=Lithohypha guttulata TaxID=1690604 RepID=UPI002DDEF7D8|nr:hypothetical protein LTR51_002834 [Lithohypha guttulata]KAK5098785.1 hypothetical protein LTS08_006163 [Lithohypha guttulata]
MPDLLTGFIALLATWQLCFARVVRAQDDNPNNVTLCGVSDFYNSTAVPYSFNNNKWGDDGTGFSCTNVLDQGESFSVTFQWRGPADTVKAFPYLKLHPERLPVQLWNASTLHFSGNWSMLVEGYDHDPEVQAVAYDNTALKANAAIDMFLSDDITNSTGLGSPIEIMIWLWYPPTMLPLGHSESTPQIDTIEVSGTNFSLYHGWNAQGQNVFSWLAHQNMTSADDDFGPLLSYIWKKGLLSGALYLGQIEFGAEVMHAGETTTFEANNYELKLYREGDKDDPNPKPTSTASMSKPTIMPTGQAGSSTSSSASATSAAPNASSSNAASASIPALSLRQKLCIVIPLVVSFFSGTLMFMN